MNKRGQTREGAGCCMLGAGKRKNGQITLFVIIAIVIVVGASLFFILRSDKGDGDTEISVGMIDVKVFVDSCIDASVEENSYLIGENGGYIEIPAERVSLGGLAYYYKNDEIYFPAENSVKESLSSAVIKDTLRCVDKFRQFKGKVIEAGEMEVGVEILSDSIVYTIYYPLTVVIGEETSVFANFGEKEIFVKFGQIHSAVENLVRHQLYDNGQLCLGCLTDFADDNNVSIYIFENNSEFSFIFEDFIFDDSDARVFLLRDDLYIEEGEGADKIFKYKFASD